MSVLARAPWQPLLAAGSARPRRLAGGSGRPGAGAVDRRRVGVGRTAATRPFRRARDLARFYRPAARLEGLRRRLRVHPAAGPVDYAQPAGRRTCSSPSSGCRPPASAARLAAGQPGRPRCLRASHYARAAPACSSASRCASVTTSSASTRAASATAPPVRLPDRPPARRVLRR